MESRRKRWLGNKRETERMELTCCSSCGENMGISNTLLCLEESQKTTNRQFEEQNDLPPLYRLYVVDVGYSRATARGEQIRICVLKPCGRISRTSVCIKNLLTASNVLEIEVCLPIVTGHAGCCWRLRQGFRCRMSLSEKAGSTKRPPTASVLLFRFRFREAVGGYLPA